MTAEEIPEADWAGYCRTMAAAALAAFVALMLFMLAVDPYDTRRTGILSRHGVPDQYPTTANASRSRDPRFDSAIFGNSRVQQLSPERLDRLTGRAFVSLIMPGSVPADQLSLLDWYLAWDRAPPRAIVMGIDAWWCRPNLDPSARFPVWLYDRSLARYVVGLVRWRSLEAAFGRIGFLRTGKGGARPDGYWDYRPVFAGLGLADAEASRRRVEGFTSSVIEPNPENRFPAIEALGEILRRAPRETAFVLVRPPVYRAGLPKPGTPAERTEAACSDALAQAGAGRPGTRILDLMRDNAMAADVANFYDHDHYRDPVAQAIEARIAVELGTGR
jgi:hypothetical protein